MLPAVQGVSKQLLAAMLIAFGVAKTVVVVLYIAVTLPLVAETVGTSKFKTAGRIAVFGSIVCVLAAPGTVTIMVSPLIGLVQSTITCTVAWLVPPAVLPLLS